MPLRYGAFDRALSRFAGRSSVWACEARSGTNAMLEGGLLSHGPQAHSSWLLYATLDLATHPDLPRVLPGLAAQAGGTVAQFIIVTDAKGTKYRLNVAHIASYAG